MAQFFHIRKNSQLPILKMKVVNDGRLDYKDIFNNLENATVTFSMKDENGRYKVYNKQGLVIPVDKDLCQEDEEYYVGYKFETRDTDRPGCYRAEFKIDFLDDGCSLIVPIYEELFVNVLDSQTISKIVC